MARAGQIVLSSSAMRCMSRRMGGTNFDRIGTAIEPLPVAGAMQ